MIFCFVFLFCLFWGIHGGVSLLLPLLVTKQQSSLAPAVSAGDVGAALPMQCQVPLVQFWSAGVDGRFLQLMLFLSGLSRLAVTFEVLNERKANPDEGVPSGACTEYFKERRLMLNL